MKLRNKNLKSWNFVQVSPGMKAPFTVANTKIRARRWANQARIEIINAFFMFVYLPLLYFDGSRYRLMFQFNKVDVINGIHLSISCYSEIRQTGIFEKETFTAREEFLFEYLVQ